MTIVELKRKVCEIIDLYADRPEHYYIGHKTKILELTRRWGPRVFLGALETCCRGSSLPFFFHGDPERWRDAYFESMLQRPPVRGGLTIELVPDQDERDKPSVDEFLKELKEACRSGRIREMAGAYRPF